MDITPSTCNFMHPLVNHIASRVNYVLSNVLNQLKGEHIMFLLYFYLEPANRALQIFLYTCSLLPSTSFPFLSQCCFTNFDPPRPNSIRISFS